MKKVIRVTVIFLGIVFIGVIGFKAWSAKLVKDMVDKNTYDVDAVSGATVSSEIIMNAVNDALQKGVK